MVSLNRNVIIARGQTENFIPPIATGSLLFTGRTRQSTRDKHVRVCLIDHHMHAKCGAIRTQDLPTHATGQPIHRVYRRYPGEVIGFQRTLLTRRRGRIIGIHRRTLFGFPHQRAMIQPQQMTDFMRHHTLKIDQIFRRSILLNRKLMIPPIKNNIHIRNKTIVVIVDPCNCNNPSTLGCAYNLSRHIVNDHIAIIITRRFNLRCTFIFKRNKRRRHRAPVVKSLLCNPHHLGLGKGKTPGIDHKGNTGPGPRRRPAKCHNASTRILFCLNHIPLRTNPQNEQKTDNTHFFHNISPHV